MDYSPFKVLIYRLIGVKIGKGVFISPQVYIDVQFPELIVIEDYVILGYGASVFTHEFISNTYRLGRVHIKRGAMIGAFSKIRSGVCIGEQANSIVNSIVIKDIPDFYKAKRDNI
jgi:acetyltransferase-like isoleucine patch superfamily enzyme